jgi:hypothetical protein
MSRQENLTIPAFVSRKYYEFKKGFSGAGLGVRLRSSSANNLSAEESLFSSAVFLKEGDD